MSKLKFLLIFVAYLQFIGSAHASIKSLAQEFLERNSGVKNLNANQQYAYFDYQDLNFQREFTLTSSYAYDDNNLENFSGLSASLSGGVATFPVISNTSSLGLQKDFDWGGSLSFDNSLQKTTITGFTPVFGFTQTLTYSQNLWRDFLGRNYRDSLLLAQLNMDEVRFQTRARVDNELTTFIGDLLSLSLNKTLVSLQKEAIRRGEKRLIITKKRVRNGLSEKVDLIQAKVSVLNQKELLKTRERELKRSLDSLGTKLHRKVLDHEIDSYAQRKINLSDIPKGSIENSFELKRIDALIKKNQKDIEIARDQVAPSLNLQAMVRNNDYDLKGSEAFSNGLIGGDAREYNISLNLSWTIGNRRENNLKARKQLEKEVSLYQLKSTKESLELTHNYLLEQIALLDDNIKFADKRKKLSRKALSEYEKLYRRGRADFDQVLQAEELMIQTESEHIQYFFERERIVYSLANTYGKIRQHLAI